MKTFEHSSTLTLSDEQIAEIKANLAKEKPQFYWDYRDKLSKEQISLIIEGKLNDVELEIWDYNTDYLWEIEKETLKSACENIVDDFEEFEDELRDLFIDDIPPIDMDLKRLFKNAGNANVRIEMYSNFDCINSHYFEGGYDYIDSYFGHTVDTLNLNPALLKKALVAADIPVRGRWPNKPKRNGQEVISYESFITENLERCCPACLWVFIGQVDLSQYIGHEGTPTKITLGKGTKCGFYSSWQGGGSIMEAETLRPLTIDLKGHGKTEYDRFSLLHDDSKGYSIKSTYGVDNSFFDGEIELHF